MRTVNEVSRLAGISVRALHHYDSIGLLNPTAVTEAGYRLYDDTALARLQTIMLFRELEFPLKEIKTLIDSPDFDRTAALKQQVVLLELRRKRLDRLISLARRISETGVDNMDFTPFDKTEIEKYEREACEKWGNTQAYREYEQRTSPSPDTVKGLMDIFVRIGKLRHLSPDCSDVQTEIGTLRQFITDNYYTCTLQIFKGLGQMYVCDERMTRNIDNTAGEGTAAFTQSAIDIYCRNITK